MEEQNSRFHEPNQLPDLVKGTAANNEVNASSIEPIGNVESKILDPTTMVAA